MRRIKYFALILVSLFIFPSIVNAETIIITGEEKYIDPYEGMEILSETTKYYKVLDYYNSSDFEKNDDSSAKKIIKTETIEVTKEEYDSIDPESFTSLTTRGSATIETTYKCIVSSIGKVGSNYRYLNSMSWKIIPSVRSYDIIGIGFLSSVTPASTPVHNINYVYSNGSSGTFAIKAINTFSRGASSTFQMPSSTSITSINMQFWVDVKKKNTNSTITYQAAYADYAHATSTISLINALKHEVIQAFGIQHDSSVSSYYDTMTEAGATWSGTW